MKTPSALLFIIFTLAFSIFFFAFQKAYSQNPVVTVRFSNPEYVCATQIYSLDVEFHCNTASKELNGMNVRFFYDDDVLEFISFGEFTSGYGVAAPNPPIITTDTLDSSEEMFGIDGTWEYVNGAIKKISSTPVTYLSTDGWTKLFNVSFHVDDPQVRQDSAFSPSVIWDLKENPAEGGFLGGGGVIINLVKVYPNTTDPATENVNQFNWQYDYIPGLPYGNPVESTCISTVSSYAPKSYIPFCGVTTPGIFSMPVTVKDFLEIKSFSLIIKYDPTVMTYVSSTPNSIFNVTNGYLTVTDGTASGGFRKITMVFNGLKVISLPDNAVLCGFQFNYLGGDAENTWRTTSSGCTYYGAGGILKCDQPYSDYFINGGAVNMIAPVIKIDSGYAKPGDYHTFPVRVWNFDDIHAASLNLAYNPSTLVFNEALPNPALGNEFTANVIEPGLLNISWTNSDTSLTDGSILMHLTFQYLGGIAPVTWLNESADCQFFHTFLPLIPMADLPTPNYYFSGSLANSVFIWSGTNSSDWNSEENWFNDEEPDENMDVIIDQTIDPENWPVFNGDFTLGETCKNLIINGNAQFVINGDLNINPGHVLSLTENGVLQVNGNWINSGIFIPGSGTIEFTGSSDAVIGEGVSPETFLSNYSISAFTGTMIHLDNGTAGPGGDDAHADVSIGFNFNFLGVSYSQVRINTNGWISFDLSGEDENSGTNASLFETTPPVTALAPWWDNLLADNNSNISYLTVGDEPFRIMTIEWNNILSYNSGSTARLNFQLKLFESLDMIEFFYGDVSDGSHSSSESASIGIKDATGGVDHFIEATQNSTSVIITSLNSLTDWPAVNYRFTPPVSSEMEVFHKIIISKPGANLSIQKDVKITGVE